MHGRAQGGFRWVIAALAALLCVPAIAHADLPAGSYVFDGDVKALTRGPDGSTYLAGSFTHEYAPVGGGVMVNRFDGGPSAFPQVAGTVYATIRDGHGGWFVGGDFGRIGGLRIHNLARITDQGQVDTSFAPNPNDAVRALALSGDTLYAGGDFTTAGGEKRLHVAAFDVPSAALTDWSVELDRTVTALAASPTTVYLGGEFFEPSMHLAAVDATTGEPRNWAVDTDEEIGALAVSGSTLYVGGGRYLPGGPYLEALDANTGSAIAGFNVHADGWVQALEISGNTLYAGGAFTTLGGRSRAGLAAFDLNTRTVTGWTPALPSKTAVTAISAFGGGVYVGGDVLAEFDDTTGARMSWQPQVSGQVRALVAGAAQTYVGGTLSGLGSPIGQIAHLARIKPDGSLDTSFNPAPNSDVDSLALSGTNLYLAGDFDHVGGQARDSVAAVNAGTGALLPWTAGADGPVRALAVAGSTVYLGGSFSHVQGETHYGLIAIAGDTGALLPWHPNTENVTRLVVGSTSLYVLVESSPWALHPAVIEVDRASGADIGSYGDDFLLSIFGLGADADTLYLSGGGSTRAYGPARGWTVNDGFGARAFATLGPTVYAGGNRMVGAYDTRTGADSGYGARPDGLVEALYTDGKDLYAAGDFTAVSGQLTGPWAKLDLSPPETTFDGTHFASDDPDATFECALDGSDYRPCSAPPTTTVVGTHTWTARAVDLSGNHDASPVSGHFTINPPHVDPRPPVETVVADPPAVVPSVTTGAIKATTQTHKPSKTIAIPFSGGYKIGNVPRALGCRGTVTLDLKRGNKRLERRSAKLDRRCRYKVTFKPTRTSVGTAKQLTVVAHFHGNRYLGATTNRFPVKVSPQ